MGVKVKLFVYAATSLLFISIGLFEFIQMNNNEVYSHYILLALGLFFAFLTLIQRDKLILQKLKVSNVFRTKKKKNNDKP